MSWYGGLFFFCTCTIIISFSYAGLCWCRIAISNKMGSKKCVGQFSVQIPSRCWNCKCSTHTAFTYVGLLEKPIMVCSLGEECYAPGVSSIAPALCLSLCVCVCAWMCSACRRPSKVPCAAWPLDWGSLHASQWQQSWAALKCRQHSAPAEAHFWTELSALPAKALLCE